MSNTFKNRVLWKIKAVLQSALYAIKRWPFFDFVLTVAGSF